MDRMIFLTFSLWFTTLLHAAVTVVPPGDGTLQESINSAADGDTLVLQDGIYTSAVFSNTITFGRAITVRASTALDNPILDAHIKVAPGVPKLARVRLQGVTLVGSRAVDINNVSLFEGLQININNVGFGTTQSFDITADRIVIIGADRNCVFSQNITMFRFISLDGGIDFLGNRFCTNSTVMLVTNGVSSELNVIGNQFIFEGGDLVLQAPGRWQFNANRLIQRHTSNESGGSPTAALLSLFSGVSGVFKNNIIKVDNSRLGSTLLSGGPLIHMDRVVMENNLFDLGNFPVAVSDPFAESPRPLLVSTSFSTAAVIVRGNIFMNHPIGIFPDEPTWTVTNNLCFNTGDSCSNGINGNLNQDPKLIDTIDYRLAIGSPAKDAGFELLSKSDLDGSRNDIGPYGGSWSIDQYDRQRDPGATGPYIYPVFDAADGATQGVVKLKFITYARQQ